MEDPFSVLKPFIEIGTLVSTIVGTAVWFTWWLGERLDKITTQNMIALHEQDKKTASQFLEVLQRLSRVEAKIDKNGSYERNRSHHA